MLRDLKVRKKIIYFMLIIVSTILLIIESTQFVYQKKEMSQRYLALTESYTSEVKSSIVAMLAFDDKASVQRFVNSFVSGKEVDFIEVAKRSDVDGSVTEFMTYGEKSHPSLTYTKHSSLLEHPDYFQSIQIVEYQDVVLGYITLRVSKQTLNENILELLYLKLLAFFGGIGIALVLINYFQRYITSPVEKLSALTRQVRESRDYSLRAVPSSKDELGELANSFNAMMEEIQVKDKQQKESSDEIMDLNKNLEYRVIERTSELQNSMEEAELARAEAEAASRSKSTFLATMSHEIRTPMNGILGAVELLLMDGVSEKQKASVLTVRSSAKSLLQIIDDVLDFSKIEAGKFEIDEVDCCLRDIVENVASKLHPISVQKNVFLKVFVDPELPDYVLADPIRIEQILINIIGNAIKFSSKNKDSDGQVKILALAESVSTESLTLKVEISDNGIGMSEEGVAKIFNAFTQADQDTTRKFGGTGLGLAIVTRLLDLMGGHLEVTSTLGEGSTFSLRLEFPLATKRSDSKYKGELVGETFTVISWDKDHQQYMGCYLEYYQAQVDYLSSIDEVVLLSSEQMANTVFVVDGSQNSELARRVLAILEEKQQEFNVHSRYVCIASYSSGAERTEIQSDSRVKISAPMLRSRLINGCCIALGVESPEVQLDFDELVYQVDNLPDGEVLTKILFAEDDHTNQFVIGSLLEKLNYEVDIVDNGRLALERWQEGDYDLLLTDAHMPEMSGYELTTIIRENEKKHDDKNRIPIVFITANALRGEEAKCLKLGADGFIPKPIELKVLRDTLSKLVLKTNVQSSDVSVEQNVSPVSETTRGFGVDIRKAVRIIFDDDEELYWMTVDSFLSSYKTTEQLLQQALNDGNREIIKEITHQLKSSVGMLGADKLSSCLGDISVNSFELDQDYLVGKITQLLLDMTAVIKEIERIRSRV